MQVTNENRFNSRVIDYKKYRPTYPKEVFEFIRFNTQKDNFENIADIGSGTGISSRQLIKEYNCNVFGVEPNIFMRLEAENYLNNNLQFISVAGTAESTMLQTNSIDLITVFQAFHWFNVAECKYEFSRILKPPKEVALIWNNRITNSSFFLRKYEELLMTYPEYVNIKAKYADQETIRYFFNGKYIYEEFYNEQRFDFDGLKGRFFSSSYTPEKGSGEYQAAYDKLRKVFELTNENGYVKFVYSTKVFIGTIK